VFEVVGAIWCQVGTARGTMSREFAPGGMTAIGRRVLPRRMRIAEDGFGKFSAVMSCDRPRFAALGFDLSRRNGLLLDRPFLMPLVGFRQTVVRAVIRKSGARWRVRYTPLTR
jgi:hypothetical protein